MLTPEFFRPIDEETLERVHAVAPDTLAAVTKFYSGREGFPESDNARVAIIGVPDYRGAGKESPESNGNRYIREKLYRLKKHEISSPIIDFGDLVFGDSIDDTYFAITEILAELLKHSVIPVILGGSQDLSVAQFNAYKQFNRLVNIAAVDSRFDLGLPGEPFGNANWLGKIILQHPNFLFNFSNIGYQTYFVGSAAIELMNKLYFDAYRVGEIRADFTEMEPVIRTADMLSFDLASIRQADAPGNWNASPNGITGEEACQAMYYAGLNDQLSSLGIYEFNNGADRDHQTAHLVAQMIWYFIEGINHRKNDFPGNHLKGFTRYNVTVGTPGSEMIFLKHSVSGRWWIELPESVTGNKKHLPGYRFLPCSYRDYQQACHNEMPDRYWQALQKW